MSPQDLSGTGRPTTTAAIKGPPAVDLLPAAVRRRRVLRALRVKCVAVLLTVVLVLVAALTWAMFARSDAQSRRSRVQAESEQLAAQIATYADLTGLRSDITAVRSAIADGMRNEVLWAELVEHVLRSLPPWAVPESMSIAITFESDFEDGSDDPLDPGEAIGTITWVVHVPTLEQSGTLLTALDAAEGLFGATFTSVDHDEETGWHKVSGSVRLDESRRSQRYAEPAADDAADQQEEAA